MLLGVSPAARPFRLDRRNKVWPADAPVEHVLNGGHHSCWPAAAAAAAGGTRAWQGDGAIQVHFVTKDGTVALVENGEQAHFLKLHHGNRRVTFDEAEGLLSSASSRLAEDA